MLFFSEYTLKKKQTLYTKKKAKNAIFGETFSEHPKVCACVSHLKFIYSLNFLGHNKLSLYLSKTKNKSPESLFQGHEITIY